MNSRRLPPGPARWYKGDVGPRANFVCLSRKCRQEDGTAAVYELPVAATRCPVCASKRLQRLFDHVNVAHGVAKVIDRVAEPTFNHQMAQQDAARQAERQNGPAFAVPIGQLSSAINRVTGGVKMGFAGGGSRPTGVAPPSLLPIARKTPGPMPGASLVDREFKVVRTRDGGLEAAKA